MNCVSSTETLCPDFLIELASVTDKSEELRRKMHEYLDNGLRLGWLIDPKNKKVEIYRPGQDVEVLRFAITLSGEEAAEYAALRMSHATLSSYCTHQEFVTLQGSHCIFAPLQVCAPQLSIGCLPLLRTPRQLFRLFQLVNFQ